MSGEMVALLLGVQGGNEESFPRLYAATNPVVLRYLRVISDDDPASAAVATWSRLVERMPGFVGDDDDDWLELVVAMARESAAPARRTPPASAVSTPARGGASADPVDEAIAALRACGPRVADVLAMGAVAGLGRDSIARITGQQPAEVLALVHEGQARLTVPLPTLVVAMRVPGRPAEVTDPPAVRALLAAMSPAPRPTTTSDTPSAATSPTGAVGAPPPSTAQTVADLLTWDSPETGSSGAAHRRRGRSTPRWARVGASAATWTVALGGLGAAAAMSGLVPGILHSLFGDEGNRPTVTAHGPAQPGQGPSLGQGGGTGAKEPSGSRPGGQTPGEPASQRWGSSDTGDALVVSAADLHSGSATQALFVPAVLTTPTRTSVAAAPRRPTGTASPSTVQRPTSGGTTVVATARTTGKDHLKHGTGQAKGRTKVTPTTAAGTGRPKHQAATKKPKATTAKTTSAKTKAASSKTKASKTAAAKAKASKTAAAKAAKVK